MIDVKQAGVGTFEENGPPITTHVIERIHGVGDVGSESISELGVRPCQAGGIKWGGCDAECIQFPGPNGADHVQS